TQPQGVLHRHEHLHRLQSLRGGLQGVERRPGGRARPPGDVLRQHGVAERELVASRGLHRAARHRGEGRVSGRSRDARPGARRRRRDHDGHRADGLPVADVLRRLQALHPCRLPRRLPDRRAVPLRVRHGRRPAGRLQRLWLLRGGLPLRRDRAQEGPRRRQQRRHRPEVHALLRPAHRGRDTGVRQGVPDRVDPVRRPRRAARAGRQASGRAARPGSDGRPPVRQRPQRRCRRQRRLLPAPRRARGVRLPAGPGRDDPGPPADVQPGVDSGGRAARRRRRVVPEEPAV
ncbi:MAG: Formate dehydrogenase O beta subunit, partial [uncultured Nocardioidaceae bacterium]